MITGEIFALELLQNLNINKDECEVVTKESKDASETVYKIKGKSKIILRDDNTETSRIVTAAHEVGHFINNRKSILKFLTFKWSGRILIGLVILELFLILMDFFYKHSTAMIYLIVVLCFLLSFWCNFVKLRDEYGANREALKLLYRYSDRIFLKHNDNRNWKSIRKEAKEQLWKGQKKYQGANYLLPIVSIAPFLVYIAILFLILMFS
ncbi:hypothetical protein E2K98_12650 [Bacillus salipaludis]|uniref:Peptidase M48 domain-containing protein n=1 Tax=Bacillus salipaludis TaxID=2547811 RepID=A0A4V3ATV8_9BACI|nr:zinc metallopeptidase [Bacillus salipaludis]TDK61733.1 hypothetical protein E2K98_12650 [Bacillus salipaludis]